MGSICGGGRYDDLTALFGLKGLSGVGVSFGADRIYDIMETLQLFPEALNSDLDVLFLNFGEKETDVCQSLCMQLRKLGFSSEVYPSNVKIQKQMKYANDRKVKWVAILGEDELSNGTIALRNMVDGNQEMIELSQFISRFHSDSAPKTQ
jgi:histidyl-tRNA synthetase